MASTESRITLTLSLDPFDWRADDKARWAQSLIEAVEVGAGRLLSVDGYELRDTSMFIRLRANEPPGRMRKLLREGEALIRLRARLADLGARPEFSVEVEPG